MKQIRLGVGNTNSSSTHAIVIASKDGYTLPKSIHFKLGEFGWAYDILNTIEERASYFYTACIVNNEYSLFLQTVDELIKEGVAVTFDIPALRGWGDVESLDNGYIDHGYELSEMLKEMSWNINLLYTFLFGSDSQVITGNDNGGSHIYAFYKGN